MKTRKRGSRLPAGHGAVPSGRRGAAPHRWWHPVTLAALLVVLLVPGPVFSQEIAAGPIMPSSAAELAVASSSEVILLQRRLHDQLEDLGISGFLDDISLKLGGSVDGDADSPAAISGSAALSAELALIPQLTLTGRITAAGANAEVPGGIPDPLSGTIGLVFDPFADPTSRDRDELAAESTAIDLAKATGAAAFGAAVAVIDAVKAGMELDLLLAQHDLAIRSLATTQALYDRERATDQQLDAADHAVRTGTQQIIRAELAAARARDVVANRTGLPLSSLEIPTADQLDLESHVVRARDALGALTASELAQEDLSVSQASLQIRSAQLDLEAIHQFTPHVSVSASGGLPDWQYSFGAEVTLSPADWDGSARERAIADLAFAESEYNYAVTIAEYDAESALNELHFSLDDLSAALVDLADSEQDMAEAVFRHERGDITALALDQAEMAVIETAQTVTLARLDVLTALLAIEYGQ